MRQRQNNNTADVNNTGLRRIVKVFREPVRDSGQRERESEFELHRSFVVTSENTPCKKKKTDEKGKTFTSGANT